MSRIQVNHREAIETSPDGYLHISKSGLVVDVNAAYCDLSGYAREELLGMHISALGESADKVNANTANIIQSGTRRFETVHRRKDGSLWQADASVAYSDVNGGEMFGFLRDISDRKKVEAALREQSEFFRLITENLDGFVAVLDLDGVRVYNSPSYVRLLGTSESAGTSSFVEIHPDDRERVVQAFRTTVATGIGQHLEYRFMLPHEEGVREMESRSGVIRDDDGRVKNVAVVSFDITERKRNEAQVRDMAFNDVLTGLPNRRLLGDRLRQTLAGSKRSGFYNAVIFLDLDNFKPINDLHGHAVGDLLLVEVAGRLKRLMREEDTVARMGGDEFVVILSALGADKAESAELTRAIAEKILAAISKPYALQIQPDGDMQTTIEHHCTASIGVALFMDHEAKPEDILHWADSAMYQAKEAGRNAICFHEGPG
jgi:diguanylate cyclase (GGDEF)-like protein/PAS domain S-box-containing protein